ncbi:MAG: CHAT domain-containing protein [Scytonema sp. PMC 1069.18]|nr:CHAT domain-containing protein [Scytonema sp. PMC 1069.18]MEC4881503.1 CHAT domain-containing protein [Scytonema sp. PMC 1070.18]
MSRLILFAVIAQSIAIISPFVLAADAASDVKAVQSQREQVVESGDGKQLLQQGLKLYQTERYSDSVEVLQQAVEKFQAQGDLLNQALGLNYVALAYRQLGQLPQASKAITESLELAEKISNKSKEYLSVRAQLLNTQGQIQLAEGKTQEALKSWEDATQLYRKNQDKEGEIGSKINQTQALQALGLYRRALITLRDVNQLLQKEPNSILKAKGLLSLGNALRVVGLLDQTKTETTKVEDIGSIQALEQSLAIASQQNSPELVSQIYLSLGNTAQALQRNADAMKYYEQAAASSSLPMLRLVAQMNQLRLSVRETPAQQKELGQKVSYAALQESLVPQIQSQLDTLPLSRQTVYARINFAQSLVCLKQSAQSTETAMSAASCPSQKTETPQQRMTTNVPEWSEIAKIAGTAVEQARKLEDKRAEAYALGTLGGLYESTGQWANAQKLTQQAIALAEGIPAPDVGYRWQWQLGRILKATGDEDGAIASYSKAVDSLKSIRSDLVAINRDVQFSFQEEVEPIYRELVSLLLESKKNQPGQDKLAKARNVIESLQLAELDNFFRRACIDAQPVQIDEVDRTAAVIYPVILSDRLEVILSVPSSSSDKKQGQFLERHTVALSKEEIEDTVNQLRQKLETRTTPEYLPLSQQVYKWIIEPIAPELEKRKIKNLVFVLDGVLRSVPMAALHDGQNFLVQKYNIALTPGLQLLNPQPLTRNKLKTIAAGLSVARTVGNESFPPLPGVKEELDEIKDTVSDTQVLLNEQFTRASIEEAVKSQNAPIVHLATHGQFSSKAEDTFILTSDKTINVNELNNLLKTRETNQRGAIELLVLSACSTAEGDNKAALGIAGVAVLAGARSTLASLWVVDDEATAIIMSEFYKQLKKPNITKAEAFKEAQLSLLKNPEYEHPYFWAPYVLVGNWL